MALPSEKQMGWDLEKVKAVLGIWGKVQAASLSPGARTALGRGQEQNN